MEAAGATLVERTTDDAAMLGNALSKVAHHLAINRRIKSWLAAHPTSVHVPVDSPAANFPICKITRAAHCWIVHLVAPQVWAWAPWRISKLKRLTDLVLCLLPFEEDYFKQRLVPAKFIGHPVLAEPIDHSRIEQNRRALPQGSPRIVMLPGSRDAEIKANLKAMLRIFIELRGPHKQAVGIVSAAGDRQADVIHDVAPEMPLACFVVKERLDAVLSWAEFALVCSGTATLDVARFNVPMVAMYRIDPLSHHLVARWVLTTPDRALPNLAAGRRIVPEFIPFSGSEEPVRLAAMEILGDSRVALAQKAELRNVVQLFAGHDPAKEAADAILGIMERKP